MVIRVQIVHVESVFISNLSLVVFIWLRQFITAGSATRHGAVGTRCVRNGVNDLTVWYSDLEGVNVAGWLSYLVLFRTLYVN